MATKETDIIYNEVELNVGYEHVPAEPQIRYTRNGDGYPGTSEELEILFIYVGSVNIITLFTDDQIEEIKQQILKEI